MAKIADRIVISREGRRYLLMKQLSCKSAFLFVFLLLANLSDGQRRSRSTGGLITRNDSLDMAWAAMNLFGQLTDTLPVVSTGDDSTAWRKRTVTSYFLKTPDSLVAIFYTTEAYNLELYYFNGPDIREVRTFKNSDSVSVSYHIAETENILTDYQLKKRGTDFPERKEYCEAVIRGRLLKSRFVELSKGKR